MSKKKAHLVDVGMKNVAFPIKAASKADPEGQSTIADISVTARIMQDFETEWIDRFMQILHLHRDRIGPTIEILRVNIIDYLEELNANTVRIEFAYPFSVEKTTPVSKEKCLVNHQCGCCAKISCQDANPTIQFKVRVPAITSFPCSDFRIPNGSFSQLSYVDVVAGSKNNVYPEDIVAIVDRNALAPVYSFLTREDQEYIIRTANSNIKTSVEMIDGIKNALAIHPQIDYYSVYCSNHAMLHTYSTLIGTEKNSWVPFSGNDYEI